MEIQINQQQKDGFLQQHEAQLRASGVPEHLFKAIAVKLENGIFDAGEYFQLLLIEYEEGEKGAKDPVFAVQALKDIITTDENAVFLIDHALTFKADGLRKQLEEAPSMVNRLGIMMGLDDEDKNLETVMQHIWRYSNFYTINAQGATVEDSLPLWYVMDELGSGIIHNGEPNFRVIPFIHTADATTYSIMFPISDVEEGDTITRDFIEGIQEDRELYLLPWSDEDFAEEPFVQVEPDASYFLKGRIEETLADGNAKVPRVDNNRPLKVYSDYEFVNQYLTDPAFEVLGDSGKSEDADILWFTKHFKGFKELQEKYPNTFINQFPFENVVTIKDLLAIVCRRSIKCHHNPLTLETNPLWLPTTYNLKTELREFVSYFQNRAANKLDNHWIIKPWNLARSLDTHITSDLSHIIRLAQTGPKIVQKYIENPVLFYRPDSKGKVKFDVRYVILVSSVEPLVAHVYKNFFLRFSNIPFSMNQFDVYEKHFTVMNYNENVVLKHLKCEDFLVEWEEQYKNHPWSAIEEKICDMLKETFTNAVSMPPPCGISNNPQSRGLYAADIMLSWNEGDTIQPKLLEINFIPDCKRACEYYSDFYNDIFKLLFLGQDNPEVFKKFA